MNVLKILLDNFSRLALVAGPLGDVIAELAASLVAHGGDPIVLVRQHQGRIRAALAN